MCGRLRGRRHAARRAHHQRLRQACRCARAGERIEVPRDDRAEVRICCRRRRTLVLPELRRDFVRGDDARVREPPPQLVRDGALVPVLPVGVKQADRDRISLDLRQRRKVERLQLAVRPHPSVHPVAALERHERLRPVRARPVELRARLAPQVQQVLEAGVRDERRASALALEQRIRRDGRPVREALDLARPGRACRGQHGLLLPLGGQDLPGRHAAVLEENGVGERAADIDAEDRHSGRLTPCQSAGSCSTSTVS